jgi:hypothetical protein
MLPARIPPKNHQAVKVKLNLGWREDEAYDQARDEKKEKELAACQKVLANS